MKKRSHLEAPSFLIALLFLVFLAINIAGSVKFAKAQTFAQDEAAEIQDYLFMAKNSLPGSSAKSLEFSLKALDLAKQSEIDSLIAFSSKSAGIAAYYLGQNSLAITYYDTALFYFEKTGNQQEIANVHNNIGVVLADLGSHHSAIDHYLIALDINRKLLNTRSIGSLYNNIGAIYYRLRDFSKALEYFQMAYKIAEMRKDNVFLLTAKNNVGLAIMDQGRYPEAKSIFLDCILLAEKNEDENGRANSEHNLGNIFLELKQPDSALFYFQKALKTYKANGFPRVRTLLGMARAYVHLKDFSAALRYYNQALDEETRFTDIEMRLVIMEEIAEIKAEQGKFREAYPLLKTYIADFKTLRKSHDSSAVQNLQAKFEVDQKIKEIQQLRNEQVLSNELIKSQQQKNKLTNAFLGVIITGLLLLILYFFLFFNVFRKYKAANANVEKDKLAQEKRFQALSKEHEKLMALHEMLATVLRSSPDICILKDSYGRWLFANETATALFGFGNFDYPYKTDDQLAEIFPFHRETFKSSVVEDDLVWQRGESSGSDEVILDFNTADPRVFELIRVPLFHADRRRKAMLIMGRDITNRKKTETIISKALVNAKNAEEMKSVFLANISNELRHPLQSFLGYGEMLATDTANPVQRELLVNQMKDSAESLLLLIDDILDLSFTETVDQRTNHKTLDINDLMEEIKPRLQRRLKEAGKADLIIDVKYFKSDLTISTDQARLRQIIRHLFDVAMKYTSRGRISLSFSLDKTTKPPQLVFTIEDSGTGVPKELRELIFQPHHVMAFPQPKDEHFTPALALSIVNKIVNLLNGQLLIESSLSKGSKVSVILPVRYANSEISTPKSAANLPYDFTGKVILVVEDVESNFDLLKIILEGSGAEVHRIENGLEAVEFCKVNKHIDLVLMDIQLPGINGYEATRLIKEFRPELPVLAQTAFALAEDKELCMEAGCDGYIAKPIKPRLLLPVISQFLN